MKQILRRKLKRRLKKLSSSKNSAINPFWIRWTGLSREEIEAHLAESEKEAKRAKIVNFAYYVDVEDFEHFYKTNHAFRRFVQAIEKKI